MAIALEWERVDKKVGTGEMVESQVKQVINDILERAGEPAIPAPSIKTWFNEWTADKGTSKSEGTSKRYKGVIDDFLKHLGDRSLKPLTVLTPRDVQSFIAKRQKLGDDCHSRGEDHSRRTKSSQAAGIDPDKSSGGR